jgi:hypothetical protein
VNRRAIGGSLLALAFGPVALGAIALGAAAQVGAASTVIEADGAKLVAVDCPAAQADASATDRASDDSIAPVRASELRAIAAAVALVVDLSGGFDASRHILALAPKTSPPSA